MVDGQPPTGGLDSGDPSNKGSEIKSNTNTGQSENDLNGSGFTNKLGSLNLSEQSLANISNKPISDISNVTIANTSSEAVQKPLQKITGRLHWSITGVVLALLAGIILTLTLGTLAIINNSHNKAANTPLAQLADSKSISLNVPVDTNQNSVLYNQTSLNAINFNGDITATGNATATTFSGNGNGLTDLSASSLASGKISDNLLESNVTLQGNTFNGPGQLVQLDSSGFLPLVNGSKVTNLDANNISSGIIQNSLLNPDVTLLGQSIPISAIQGNIISSINNLTNDGGDIELVAGPNVQITTDNATKSITIALPAGVGTITGVTAGTGLTGGGNSANVTLSVDNTVTLQGNTFNVANGLLKLDNSGALPALNGGALTSLNASNITAGTISDNRLSANVCLNSLVCSSYASVSTDAHYIQNTSVKESSGANYNIQSASATSVVGVLEGATGQTADLLDLDNSAGNVIAGFSNNGELNLGSANAQSGQLSFANSSNSNIVTLQVDTSNNGNNTITIPDETGTICTTAGSAACLAEYNGGGGGGGTNVQLQSTTPGTAQVGDINVTGTIIGGTIVGSGANITNLNASNISSGTIANTYLSSSVTLQGNTFNGNSQLVQTTSGGALPTLSGANLTSLNATNLSSGTVNNSRLSASVTLQGNTFNGNSQLVQTTSGGLLPVINGSNLTSLNGSAISSGTVSDTYLQSNVTLQGNAFNGNSQLVQTTSGGLLPAISGTNLTNLNGSAISSGTVGNSFLSASVTLQGNTFNAANDLVQLNSSAALPAVNAANLTNLNASNIASGTVGNSFLSASVTLQGNTFNGNSQLVQTTSGGLLPAISGANLTSLNATNLSSGTVNNSRLSASVTLEGNTFNAANDLVQLNGSGALPAVSGTNLTNLNGSAISSGTVGNSFLSSSVTLQGNTFNAANDLVQLNGSGALPVLNGANLSSLNASNISSGTIGNSYLSNSVTIQGNTFNGANELLEATNLGYLPANNGSLVTNLNGSNVSSGTVADARLSSNVALLNGTNSFSGSDTFTQPLTVNSIQPSSGLTVGATGQSLALQGNASTTLTSTISSHTITIGFSGTPTGNVTYDFDATANPSGSPYTICTTASTNCGGGGSGGNASATGSNGTIAEFNGTHSLTNSDLTDSSGTLTIGEDGVIKPTTDSKTVFEIQNQAGTSNLFDADTTDSRIGIGTLTPGYTLDVNGNVNVGTTLYVGGNPVCTSSGCNGSSGSGFYIQNGVGSQTAANFNIQSASTTDVGGVIQGAVGQTADLLDLENSGGSIVAGFSAAGNLNVTGQYEIQGSQIASSNLSDSSNLAKLNGTQSFTGNNTFTGTFLDKNASNSTTAFEIQNHAGTSNLFDADTTDSRIGIGTLTPGYTLDVNGDINIASGSLFRINGVAICANSGICAPASGSTYYIQNGTTSQPSGANFNIQTVSPTSVVGVLQGASGQTADLLDLENSSSAVVAGFTSNGQLNLGAANTQNGQLTFANSTNGNIITLKADTTNNGNNTLIIPDESGTICTTAGSSACLSTYSNSTNDVQLQSTTPGTIQPGNIDVNGTVIGGVFSGSGADLTTLNGSAISSGTVGDSYLQSDVTIQGNTFNGNSQLVQTTSGGALPSLSGANLTSLNATNLSSGTVSNSRLSASVTLQGNTFNGNSQLVQTTSGGALPVISGANLTNLNGSAISSGTVSDSYLQSNVTTQGNTFNGNSQLVQTTSGGALPVISGANLTNLNGSAISSGTVSDSYLQSNVTTQGNTFNGNSQLVQTTSGGALPVISGANLTSLSGSAITSGTVGDAYLQSNVTLQGNTFNGNNDLVQLDGSGALPSIPGAALTSLNGSSISTGTVGDAYLQSNVTIQGNTFNAANDLVQLTSAATATLPVLSGVNLTNLNGSAIASGTVGDSYLQNNVTIQGNTFNAANDLVQLTSAVSPTLPALSGANLNSLNASNISSGTLGDAYLPSDVCLAAYNCSNYAQQVGDNHYIANSTTSQTGGGNINIQTASPGSVVAVFQGAATQTGDLLDLENSNNYILDGFTAAGTLTFGSHSTGDINSQSGSLELQGGTTNETLSNSGDVVQTTSNASSAFQVQNANGDAVFSVNTSSLSTSYSAQSFETNASGWTAYPSGSGATAGWVATGTLTNGIAGYNSAGALKIVTNATSTGEGAEYALPSTLSPSTTYYLSFEAMLSNASGALSTLTADYSYNGSSVSQCGLLANSTQTIVATGWTQITCEFITPSSPTSSNFIAITDGTSGNAYTFWINALQLQTGAVTNYPGSINTPVTFANASNSTTAFQIQGANGTGSLLIADTVNNRIEIGGVDNNNYSQIFSLDVQGPGGVNSNSGYAFQGVSGTTLGAQCTSSQVLSNANVQGGIITHGSCAGVAAPTQSTTEVLTPEYAGAVLDNGGQTSSDIGTMVSGFTSSGTNSEPENYYSWTTSQSSAQSYDVVISVPLPSDWDGWSSTTPISMDLNYTSGGSVKAAIWDTNGNVESSWGYTSSVPGCTLSGSSGWPGSPITGCAIGGTYNAGGVMTIRVRLTAAANGGITKLGNITLKYLASY